LPPAAGNDDDGVARAATAIIMAKVASNGAFQGENPLDFALPLIILQICLVLVVTRGLAYLLRPLRQPRVIAEIIVSALLARPSSSSPPPTARPTFTSSFSIAICIFQFYLLASVCMHICPVRSAVCRRCSTASRGPLPTPAGLARRSRRVGDNRVPEYQPCVASSSSHYFSLTINQLIIISVITF